MYSAVQSGKVMGKTAMKIAVMGDIHGNLTALEACLAYAKHLRAEGFVFLGDLVVDCPDPHAVVELVRQLADQYPCWFVRGNREEKLIEHSQNPDDGWCASSQTGALLYTYEHLTEQDMAFLSAMPKTDQLQIDGCPPIRLCHSTPTQLDDVLYPGAERTDQVLRSIEESTMLTGHSHMQFRYETNGKQLINPGSVGVPSNGQVRAQFALLHCEGERWVARMLNVEYDRDAEIARFAGSELNEMAGVWAILMVHALKSGHSKFQECLALAQRLAQAGNGQIVADSFWQAAAKELGVI